jgi:hypothetical protein
MTASRSIEVPKGSIEYLASSRSIEVPKGSIEYLAYSSKRAVM